jgi:glycosyltransferase involved in cell wall biosynthesis
VATVSFYLQQSFTDLRSDIRYLPNALDISRYVFKQRDTVEPKLIWLRAFLEHYQPQLAIQTLAELHSEFPNTFLTMIGPDKCDGSLMTSKALADSLEMSQQVEFIGVIKKNQVPTHLQKGDIYLNTTRYESFGVAVLEAAACGLPIVSTSVGEIPYLWTSEENILLVSPKDSRAMAEAIKRILVEPGLAEKLSRNARKKAEQFDWSIVLPKWDALFEELKRSSP